MGNVIMKAQQIAYGASNVEKALDDLKAPELIELNKRMDAIDAWKANVHEETYTGSELTIENALALPARSLITSINAIQDLHGQSAPYVGGSGKNKLILDLATIKANNTTGTWNGNVYSIAGGTVEILTDSANNATGIKINGTFNSAVQMAIDDYTIPLTANSYIFTCGLNNDGNVGADNNSGIFLSNINGNNSWLLSFADITFRTFTISDPTKLVRCGLYIWEGATVNNLIYYPMIRLSSEQTGFAPYSNICPISGRTGTTVTVSDGDETSADFTIAFVDEHGDPVTVYGGTINFTTGVASVTKAIKDMGDMTWYRNTTEYAYPYFYANISDRKTGPQSPLISSCYPTGTDRSSLSDNMLAPYNLSTSNAVAIRADAYTDASNFKTAMDGQTICYELAEPIELTLTPTEVQMLKGYNRVTIDNGSIELKALVLGGDN